MNPYAYGHKQRLGAGEVQFGQRVGWPPPIPGHICACDTSCELPDPCQWRVKAQGLDPGHSRNRRKTRPIIASLRPQGRRTGVAVASHHVIVAGQAHLPPATGCEQLQGSTNGSGGAQCGQAQPCQRGATQTGIDAPFFSRGTHATPGACMGHATLEYSMQCQYSARNQRILAITARRQTPRSQRLAPTPSRWASRASLTRQQLPH